MMHTIAEIVMQPGWDAGYYTGTIITGAFALFFNWLVHGTRRRK